MAAGSGLNKPDFSPKQAVALVEREFGLKVPQVKPLPSYDDQNFYVCVAPSEGNGEKAGEYVLKIVNCEDSQNPDLIEVQTRIMMFLNKEGFPVPTPRFTKEGEIMFLESLETPSGPKAYMARLLTYLPGQTVAKVPVSPPLLYEIGQLAARLDKTLTEACPSCRATFPLTNLSLSSLDSVSWRVDYTLSSSQLQQVNEPVVHLKLNVKDVDRGSLEPVAMTLSAEKFRVLLAELKQAQALLKTLD
ncbi:hypothetical protein JRQ81_006762 [Phrynocephalus forsythii]|uniref:Hydroxylysine kinase n=1 Tax=Phrynocephalus forsythii TaxID=171643 RepID=A0A9Q0XFL7_9SAUR|nr:hypothetical protein JRQ81_006762 [Phrynocephalus forsythii]